MKTRLVSSDILFVSIGGGNDRRKLANMKQYKIQELVGNTKKLPCPEKLFYETLISFRKLPECAELFLPLQIHSHFKSRRNSSKLSDERYGDKNDIKVKRQCSKEEEEVQSYAEWKIFMSWIKLSSWRYFRRLRKSVLYILPIGPFPDGMLSSLVSPQLTFLQALITFGESFFMGMSIKPLPVIEYKEIGCTTRLHNRTGQLQLFLPDVMHYLTTVIPKNAIGIVALSWIDFYPDEHMNSILGEGSVYSGCAAISFGHYGLYKPENESISSSRSAHPTSGASQSITSENSLTASKSSKDQQAVSLISNDFKENRFPKSLLNEASRRKASSSISININRSSVMSTTSMNSPLSRSASSYKNLGSLSSIENSWTKLFSRSVDSLCSNSSVDDASYDIINRDEADVCFTDFELEENLVKLAMPLGCKFKMTCSTVWRLFKAFSHEVCHLFGLSHCSFYECIMNGSHRISEVDEQPIFLCPVCLRKLQKFLKFRLMDRYWRLSDVYNRMMPCYAENISVFRDCAVDEITADYDADNYVDDYTEGTRRRSSCDATGHICIEVTREKNEGYDIINVEYKKGFENDADAHDCALREACNKLQSIVAFLNRY